jgi:osmotically-inducible protein OsmY
MRKYLYVLFLLMSVCLQGCIVLAAAGAGAAGTAVVVNDRRSLQTMTDDQNIERTAQGQVEQDVALTNNTHVAVVSFNHAVLLAGQVPSDNVKQKLQNMVQALPKVTRVYNELEIAPPASPATMSKDAWITAKVKTSMITAKNLSSGQIKVVTESGTVFLMGIVTHSQADTAADVARRVDGVQHVVTLFEYTML